MSNVKILGLKDVEETLKTVSPVEARRIARRSVTAIAKQGRDKMRSRVAVHTKNLYKSIKSRRARGKPDRAEAEIYVDKSGRPSGKGYHWHMIEFGTVKMSPQPFVVPTIEEMRPKMPMIYRQQWWVEYEKEMVKRAKKQKMK